MEESFGTDVTENLHKSITAFMNISLTKNVPYVIQSVLESKIETGLLMDVLIKCITFLYFEGFNVEACVCEKHLINVSTHRKLLAQSEKTKIYDAVNLTKNIRNSLLN